MTPWKYIALTGRRPPRRLFGIGLGAGLLGGAVMLGLRYFIRPPVQARLPDTAAGPAFRSRVFASSHGQVVYHESVFFPDPDSVESEGFPPLVFVHDFGVGVSSYEWSKVAAAFAGPHRVLAPDLIGFGESERPHVALRPAGHVAVLAEFLQATLYDSGAVLIASGGGAALCAQLAAEHPALVRRLVLLAPRGRAGVAWWRRVAVRVPNLGRYLYRNVSARRERLRHSLETTAFADPARVTDEMVEVFTLCAQQYLAGIAVRAWWAGWLDVDLEKNFAQLLCPTTLLLAAGSTIHDKETAARLAAINPRAVAGPPRTLSDGGPLFAALEAPETLAAVLREEFAAAENGCAQPVAAREI